MDKDDELWEAAWPKVDRERPTDRVAPESPRRTAPTPRVATRSASAPPRVRTERVRAAQPDPAPISERRVYRAGDEPVDRRRSRRPERVGDEGPAETPPGRKMRRTPYLAVIVLIAIAVVITFAGMAARDGGLDGPQSDAGQFKLLPLTTTTTS